ncbi:MAG: hypothetical protein AAGC85_02290 [Bacteroidota bacterium]
MISLLAYWSLVGWCGTVPRRFPFPIPPNPDPTPWWANIVFSVAGGIAGGFLVSQGLGFDEIIATSFGAFAGGRIVSELGSNVFNAKAAAQ